LQERVGRGAHLRLRRRGPVAEGEEADVFHGGAYFSTSSCLHTLTIAIACGRKPPQNLPSNTYQKQYRRY
jgi:hypothetical protein